VSPTSALWLALIVILLLVAGTIESLVHRRNLAKIPTRIHVNGTRGKSSVTRLIAAGLREAGLVVCAKTTGTAPRFILPDGRELPVYRPSEPNVIEQRRIVSAAAARDAQVLVIECMALTPELQALSEQKLIRATHAVITNARPDHLDRMGPAEADVAAALASVTPLAGKLYTAEQKHRSVLEHAARDRQTELVAVEAEEIARVSPAELAGFAYTEHPDNLALALRVCADFGVDRAMALRGMQKAKPDPGALREFAVESKGRRIIFVNAFAANDPVTTEQLWNMALERHPGSAARIALFNCRADRPDRSIRLARALPGWAPPHRVLVMGSATHLFAKTAIGAGLDPAKLEILDGLDESEVFERLIGSAEASALVMGMGNIGGDGLPLVRRFARRALFGSAT